jgi:hypothetical protein
MLADQQLRQQVVDLRLRLLSAKSIAGQLRIDHNRIAGLLGTPDPAIAVLQGYADRDISAAEIARRHGVNAAAIYAALKHATPALRERFAEMARVQKRACKKACQHKPRFGRESRPPPWPWTDAECTLRELVALRRASVPRYDARAS